MLVLSVRVFAASDEPSSWAETEVNAAIEEGIVPDDLEMGYTSDIKRYEYVLLALQLLDANQDTVTVTRQYPFTDIIGHPYEEAIVKAYNAGIIKGNGDGTFRPDDPITRQEIASLVYNLVKRLEHTDELVNAMTYTYADESQIGSWAKPYIDYVYRYEIMNGTGKNASGAAWIEPLGKATREQAILLLYRLANQQELFKEYDLGTVPVMMPIEPANDASDIEYEKQDSPVINDVARTLGEPFAKAIIKVASEENVVITSLSENVIQMDLPGGSQWGLLKLDNKIRSTLYFERALNARDVDIMLGLLRPLTSVELLEADIQRIYGLEEVGADIDYDTDVDINATLKYVYPTQDENRYKLEFEFLLYE